MRKANAMDREARRAPAPDDLAGWKRWRDAMLAAQIGLSFRKSVLVRPAPIA
jgi:hypothetical protein